MKFLIWAYFDDYKTFQKCQDIPAKYLIEVDIFNKCYNSVAFEVETSEGRKLNRLYPLRAPLLLSVSHRWISKENPDPDGAQFRLIKEYIKKLMIPCFIFYDYSCLYQSPRDENQESTFSKDLKQLNYMFSSTSGILLGSEDYFYRSWCVMEFLCGKFIILGDLAPESKEVEDIKLSFDSRDDDIEEHQMIQKCLCWFTMCCFCCAPCCCVAKKFVNENLTAKLNKVINLKQWTEQFICTNGDDSSLTHELLIHHFENLERHFTRIKIIISEDFYPKTIDFPMRTTNTLVYSHESDNSFNDIEQLCHYYPLK